MPARYITYDAFGNIAAETDVAISHLFGYTGREFDKSTGLQYNRERYYDPKLGRFISQDPISFAAGDANLYRYVGNHGTFGTDPSGFDEVSSPWLFGNDVTYTPENDFTGLFGIGFEWDYTSQAFSIGKLSSDGLYVEMESGHKVPLSAIREFARTQHSGIWETSKELACSTETPRVVAKRNQLLKSIAGLAPTDAVNDSALTGVYNAFAKPIGAIGNAIYDIPGTARAMVNYWTQPLDKLLDSISESNMKSFDKAFDSYEDTDEFATSTAVATIPADRVLGMFGRAIEDFVERLPVEILYDRNTLSTNGLGGIRIVPKSAPKGGYLADFQSKNTIQRSGMFNSEGQARQLAREKLGANPINIGDNKLRSIDGKWQYRAKPVDTTQNHVHLERLDPLTGEVLENWHLNWPQGAGQ